MPILAHYGAFPELDTEATLYTPDRSLGARFDDQLGGMQGNSRTEMMIVHVHPLEVGLYYRIAGRVLRVDSESTYREFRARCPNAPALLRPEAYKFYFAIPDEDE